MIELLKMPDYIDTDPIGRMIGLYCKVCGAKIGEDRRGNFLRFANYAEIKIAWDDGTMHVTNLCHDCVRPVTESPELMDAMWHADLDIMVEDVPQMDALRAEDVAETKVNPMCIAVELKRRGLA